MLLGRLEASSPIAFVVEHASVRRILRHLGRPPQRPESLANSSPEELDRDFELVEFPD